MDRNKHLKKVLETHDMKHVENLDRYINKKNKVKEALAKKYSQEKASNPIDSGSYAKNTANNSKFDIDCCIPFKKKTKESENGFQTLQEMFDHVYDYLRNEYTKEDDDLDKENVRKQKVSIGLKFIFEDDDVLELDVVPGRERPNHGDYNEDNTDLSLHIHKRSEKEKKEGKTRIKTNIKKHTSLLKAKPHERKVSRLLKVWKIHKKEKDGGKLIKSFMMELYTKEAFEKNKIPHGLWPKTKMVMEYIIDNIVDKNLIDPANSDNIVSHSMSDSAKKDTKKALQTAINEIEEDSNKIKNHFPINEEYEEANENSTNAIGSSASILGTNKFG